MQRSATPYSSMCGQMSGEQTVPSGCSSDWLTGWLFFSTYRGDRLDFEPAQDAGQLVGRGVGGPLNPHVLQKKKREKGRKAGRQVVVNQR